MSDPSAGGGAPSLEELARQASTGDRSALERVVAAVRDPIYRLALRMLSDPDDAEDCTQEILILVVTHLGSFEGRSKLLTWIYKIASRHLLRARKRAAERSVIDAEAFGAWLDAHVAPEPYAASSEAEYRELCEEVRIGCTYGMLLVLSRELRLAYILGDLLELSDKEGAEALEITPAAFRQRLARARRTVRPILAGRCSLVVPGGSCSCDRQISAALECGLIPRSGPVYTRLPRLAEAAATPTFKQAAEQLDIAERFAQLFRGDPAFAAPARVMGYLQAACPDLFGEGQDG